MAEREPSSSAGWANAVHPDFPLPDVSWPPAREFWEGASRRQLLIPGCDRCGQLCWYPEISCRECGGTFSWRQMSGRGTLFSWTVVRHPWVPQFLPLLPIVSALVTLAEDERVRLVTQIVDADPASLVPDMAVEATFRPLQFPPATASVMAPMFRPSPARSR